MQGARIGGHVLIERLGRGGMGEVWRARHLQLGREVALKLIRTDLVTDDEARGRILDRFEREARVTAGLASPHTVRVFDFGRTDDGDLWYAMELLDGVDLESLIERFGPLPPARAISLLRQAARSLAEAHALGLVHRDVKPSNLLLCRAGVEVDLLKVVDFGLVLPAERETRLTRQGSLTGSPAFLAPELALGTADADGRADLYGLGCVGIWLLTGELVFAGPTTAAQLVAHARETPRSLRERRPELPADLDALVASCLAKEPAGRPADAAALVEALDGLADAEGWRQAEARQWWAAHGASLRRPSAHDVAHAATISVGPHLSASVAASVVASAAPTLRPATAAPAALAAPGLAIAPVPPAASAATSRAGAPAAPRAPDLRRGPRQRREAISGERAQVVEALSRAFAESRIDLSELEVRLDAAQRSEAIPELQRLVADLPDAPLLAPATPAAAPFAATEGPLAVRQASDRIVAIFGGVERGGARMLPRSLQVFAAFGGVELDLTEAIWPAEPVVIEANAIFGGVEIIVPLDVEVLVEGTGILGGYEGGGAAQGATRGRLVVRGVALFGGVVVERPAQKRRWLEHMRSGDHGKHKRHSQG